MFLVIKILIVCEIEFFALLLFHVDATPPSFGRTCPHDFRVFADKGQFSSFANWSEPTASDNSGLLPKVTSNFKSPPVRLNQGDHVVLYTAWDSAGNRGFCSFKVSVVGKGFSFLKIVFKKRKENYL